MNDTHTHTVAFTQQPHSAGCSAAGPAPKARSIRASLPQSRLLLRLRGAEGSHHETASGTHMRSSRVSLSPTLANAVSPRNQFESDVSAVTIEREKSSGTVTHFVASLLILFRRAWRGPSRLISPADSKPRLLIAPWCSPSSPTQGFCPAPPSTGPALVGP